MTNLSERVLKAKKAQYIRIPGSKKIAFGTSGSGKYRYQIFLSSTTKIITSSTSKTRIPVLLTECYRNSGVGTVCNCLGTRSKTICRHALGSLFADYKSNNKHISFYESKKTAIKGLNIGGGLAKIQSKQGNGSAWAVIRDIKPKSKSLNNLAVNLMRGNENDEGID